MRLDDIGDAGHPGAAAYRFPGTTESVVRPINTGIFRWAAARNCVEFYLQNRRPNLNPRKYHAFMQFLSLPMEDARKTNVWRWYFKTGGHPPFDPRKKY